MTKNEKLILIKCDPLGRFGPVDTETAITQPTVLHLPGIHTVNADEAQKFVDKLRSLIPDADAEHVVCAYPRALTEAERIAELVKQGHVTDVAPEAYAYCDTLISDFFAPRLPVIHADDDTQMRKQKYATACSSFNNLTIYAHSMGTLVLALLQQHLAKHLHECCNFSTEQTEAILSHGRAATIGEGATWREKTHVDKIPTIHFVSTRDPYAAGTDPQRLAWAHQTQVEIQPWGPKKQSLLVTFPGPQEILSNKASATEDTKPLGDMQRHGSNAYTGNFIGSGSTPSNSIFPGKLLRLALHHFIVDKERAPLSIKALQLPEDGKAYNEVHNSRVMSVYTTPNSAMKL